VPTRAFYCSGKWKRLSRYVRFARARGYCEHCGVPHGAISADGGSLIVLECAHLNGNSQDLRAANLRALCPPCHRIFDEFRRVHTLLRRYPRAGSVSHSGNRSLRLAVFRTIMDETGPFVW
jgi:hypothetical protein